MVGRCCTNKEGPPAYPHDRGQKGVPLLQQHDPATRAASEATMGVLRRAPVVDLLIRGQVVCLDLRACAIQYQSLVEGQGYVIRLGHSTCSQNITRTPLSTSAYTCLASIALGFR